MIFIYSSKDVRNSKPRSQIFAATCDVCKDVTLVDIADPAGPIGAACLAKLLAGETVINLGDHRYAGSKVLGDFEAALQGCDRIIALTDDYTASLPTQFRRAVEGKPNVTLTNMPEVLEVRGHLKAWSCFVEAFYVNWNILSYKPAPFCSWSTPGLMYFGSFRPSREPDFLTYFADTTYPVVISSSARGHKKFTGAGIYAYKEEPKWPATEVVEHLAEFQSTIYVEDVESHTLYNSPANRFYEAVSAGVLMLFDAESQHTFDRAGHDVSRWVVKNAGDVARWIDKESGDRPEARRQRAEFAVDATSPRRNLQGIFTELGVL